MVICAVTNQKGGVGKTTTAVNLSAALAAMHYHVLLIDLDSQCNATVGSGLVVASNQVTLSEVLYKQADINQAVIKTNYGFHIIPSNHRLTAAEMHLLNKPEKEFYLKKSLEKLSNQYHYVIIDCPPALNILTINALVAAHNAIIPVQCEYYALEGLAKLLKTIEALKTKLDTQIAIDGILRTMYDGRNLLTRQVSEQLIKSFGKRVYQTVIPRNVRLAEAPSHGMPIVAYDKHCHGSSAYLALAAELIRRWKATGMTHSLLEGERYAG